MRENDLWEVFHQLQKHRTAQDLWNEQLYKQSGPEEWLEVFRIRARGLANACEESRVFLQQLKDCFEQGTEADDARYDTLWDCTKDMYEQDYEDPFLLELFCGWMLPHYEKKQDLDRLTFLHLWMGYAKLEISRTGDAQTGKDSVEEYRWVAEKRSRIAEFQMRQNVVNVAVAYSNLTRTESSLGNCTMEESWHFWEEVRRWRESEAFPALAEENPRLQDVVDFLLENFFSNVVVEALEYPEDNLFRKETIRRMSKLYLKEGEPDKNLWMEDYENCAITEYLLVLMKKHTWRQALEEMSTFYEAHPISIGEAMESNNAIGWLFNPLERQIGAVQRADLTQEEKEAYLKHLHEELWEMIRKLPFGKHVYTQSSAIQSMGMNESFMSLLETEEEKEEFLVQMVLGRQIPTYLHSLMVSLLAQKILEYALEIKPELFVGLPGMKDVKMVQRNASWLKEYVRRAALYHDLGKTVMYAVINTETRRLTDHEFQIIRTHPESGVPFLEKDPILKKYTDIVIGHHRSYDGTMGYPMTFENTKSPWKPIIDLITICDCMDAATDYMGRNYQRAKKFDQLLEELEKGAGTWYHPELVALIRKTPELHAWLREQTEKKREEMYYRVYERYFEQ